MSKKRRSKYVWLRVSKDKYEFPEVIADSAIELARECGVRVDSIHSAISHARERGGRSQWVKVKRDWEV